MKDPTPHLVPLHPDHAEAVLAFEIANREYFTGFIDDRGDAYFEQFAERFGALLAEQAAGVCAFYLLIDGTGGVLGRFNLVDIEAHVAELGYRVAQHVAGRGVATETVQELCRLAATRHGLRTVRAGCSPRNLASQRVLRKSGFVPVPSADPVDEAGGADRWFERDLTADRRTLGKPPPAT